MLKNTLIFMIFLLIALPAALVGLWPVYGGALIQTVFPELMRGQAIGDVTLSGVTTGFTQTRIARVQAQGIRAEAIRIDHDFPAILTGEPLTIQITAGDVVVAVADLQQARDEPATEPLNIAAIQRYAREVQRPLFPRALQEARIERLSLAFPDNAPVVSGRFVKRFDEGLLARASFTGLAQAEGVEAAVDLVLDQSDPFQIVARASVLPQQGGGEIAVTPLLSLGRASFSAEIAAGSLQLEALEGEAMLTISGSSGPVGRLLTRMGLESPDRVTFAFEAESLRTEVPPAATLTGSFNPLAAEPMIAVDISARLRSLAGLAAAAGLSVPADVDGLVQGEGRIAPSAGLADLLAGSVAMPETIAIDAAITDGRYGDSVEALNGRLAMSLAPGDLSARVEPGTALSGSIGTAEGPVSTSLAFPEPATLRMGGDGVTLAARAADIAVPDGFAGVEAIAVRLSDMDISLAGQQLSVTGEYTLDLWPGGDLGPLGISGTLDLRSLPLDLADIAQTSLSGSARLEPQGFGTLAVEDVEIRFDRPPESDMALEVGFDAAAPSGERLGRQTLTGRLTGALAAAHWREPDAIASSATALGLTGRLEAPALLPGIELPVRLSANPGFEAAAFSIDPVTVPLSDASPLVGLLQDVAGDWLSGLEGNLTLSGHMSGHTGLAGGESMSGYAEAALDIEAATIVGLPLSGLQADFSGTLDTDVDRLEADSLMTGVSGVGILTVKRFGDGPLSVQSLNGSASLSPDIVALDGLQAQIGGGTISIPAASILLTGDAIRLPVSVEAVALGPLVEALEVEGLAIEGEASGGGIVVLTADSIQFEGVRLTSEDGVLSYVGAAGNAITASEAALAFDVLENFRYDEMVLSAEGDLTGEQSATLRLEGANPDVYEGYPVALNINLSGALSSIIQRSVDAYALPERLQQSLFGTAIVAPDTGSDSTDTTQ